MDESTAALITSLSHLQLSDQTKAQLQPIGDAFQKYFDHCKITVPILRNEIRSLKEALLKDGGVSLDDFCTKAHVYFEVCEQSPPSTLLTFMRSFNIKASQWTGSTEDEMHFFVETALSAPLNTFFSNSFRVTRNNKIETSAGRGDYSLSKNERQILRGEDKLRKVASSQNPEEELQKKTVCESEWVRFYGNHVSYIFGYFCIGEPGSLALQFVIITKDRNTIHLTREPFNLCSFSGMLACRFFVLSLYPHMLAVYRAIDSNVALDWTMTKESQGFPWQSSTVSVGVSENGMTCFVKEWCFRTRSSLDFYNQLKILQTVLPKSPHLLAIVSVTHKAQLVRARFMPFANPCMVNKFDNIQSAKLCLLHITLAVQALHKVRLVHNDIRWPNVVCGTDGNYVLVDYDLVAVLDEKNVVPPIPGLDADSHSPLIFKPHGCSVDIWGLGYLMITCQVAQQDAQSRVFQLGSAVQSDADTKAPDTIFNRIIKFCTQD